MMKNLYDDHNNNIRVVLDSFIIWMEIGAAVFYKLLRPVTNPNTWPQGVRPRTYKTYSAAINYHNLFHP